MEFENSQFLSPCVICWGKIASGDKVVYCPECGQAYHLECWEKKGKTCKLKGCRGDTKNTLILIEKILLSTSKTSLRNSCSRCGSGISVLYRYCPSCGLEVNSKKNQSTLVLLPLAKFIHHRKIELGISSLFMGIVIMALFVVLILHMTPRPDISSPIPEITQYFTSTRAMQYSTLPKATSYPILKYNPTATLSAPTTSFPTPVRKTCPGAPPIRVEEGDTARVTFSCGDHIYMRINPVVGSNVKQYLYGGDELKIIEGPHCSNDVSFFLVEAPKYNKTGWVAEAEPDSTNYCIQIDH